MRIVAVPASARAAHLSPRSRTARRALCLALALAAPAAFAADWYVDGKSGSDNNTGSQSAPFLHIWRGWQMAKPGDTVHILPTVVYGHQYFGNKSGLPGAPITIQG
ncbi:MAG: hypothetical protein ACTHKB_04680, partial [Burkholderiaceae bacterium]